MGEEMTGRRRALSEAAARKCENATHTRCKCRCGGRAHGAARISQEASRAAYEQLPPEDPHHLPTEEEKRQRARDLLKARATVAPVPDPAQGTLF